MIAKHFKLLTEAEKSQVVSLIRRDVDGDVLSQAEQMRKGKHCYKYVRGQIFTDSELKEIDEQEKVAVQTTEGMVKLSSMMGHIMRTAKEGHVIGNGPEDAAPAEFRDAIIKDDISANSGMERIKFQVTQDVLVTGVPTWAWIDNTDPEDVNKPGLSVSYQPWDSVIPDAGWRDPNLRDLRRLTRIRQMTREEVAQVWFDGQSTEALRQYEKTSQAIASRESLSSDFLRAQSGDNISATGLINVFETLQPVYTEIMASVGTEPGDIIHLPINFTPEQIQEHEQTTGRTVQVEKSKVMWSTIWTASGLLLDHGPCWFQAGGYPAACLVPASVDGYWCGIIEFSLDFLKMLSYLYTEQLQGVRTVNNNVNVIVKGAFDDKRQAKREMAKAGGIVEMADGVGTDGIRPLNNARENQAFNDAIGSTKDLLDRLTVERNAEGGSQASQESSKAIGARMDANLTKLSYFIQGLSEFQRQLNRKLVQALPFGYPTYRAIRLRDPENGTIKQAAVNEPNAHDWTGEVISMVNKLDSGTWDWVFTDSDTSVSGREQARAVYAEFMKNFGNLDPQKLEIIALSYPSTDVQEMGRKLKDAREAAEKSPPPPPPAKVSFTADLSALGSDALQQIAIRENLIEKPAPPPPPAPGPGGPQPPPMPQQGPEGMPMGMPPEGLQMNPEAMPQQMEM